MNLGLFEIQISILPFEPLASFKSLLSIPLSDNDLLLKSTAQVVYLQLNTPVPESCNKLATHYGLNMQPVWVDLLLLYFLHPSRSDTAFEEIEYQLITWSVKAIDLLIFEPIHPLLSLMSTWNGEIQVTHCHSAVDSEQIPVFLPSIMLVLSLVNTSVSFHFRDGSTLLVWSAHVDVEAWE